MEHFWRADGMPAIRNAERVKTEWREGNWQLRHEEINFLNKPKEPIKLALSEILAQAEASSLGEGIEPNNDLAYREVERRLLADKIHWTKHMISANDSSFWKVGKDPVSASPPHRRRPVCGDPESGVVRG
jgi:hypothetical protein